MGKPGTVIYVSIGDAEFRDLVAGKRVEMRGRMRIDGPRKPDVSVHVVLSDIGWDRMRQHVDDAHEALLEREFAMVEKARKAQLGR